MAQPLINALGEVLEIDDDDWINKIEEEDNLYNDFYYEKNENVLIS